MINIIHEYGECNDNIVLSLCVISVMTLAPFNQLNFHFVRIEIREQQRVNEWQEQERKR